METELFKPFPLALAVMVGNKGTIKRPNGRLASKTPDSVGYLKITIMIDGVLTAFKQHRVVGLTWVPNPDNLPEINHLDGIKTNNVPSNLQWCTHQDNIKHGRASGLWTSPTGRPKGYKQSAATKEKQRQAKLGRKRSGFGGAWL